MKKLILMSTVLLLFSITNSFAQRMANVPPPPHDVPPPPPLRSADYLDRLKIVLDLSDEQYTEIEQRMISSHQDLKKLHEEAKAQRVATKEKMEKLRAAEREKLKSVLNDEQKAKFEELEKLKEERMKNKKDKSSVHHRRKHD